MTKRILAVVAAILSAIGIITCLLGIFFSWSYNTPVTESLVGMIGGAERVLTAAEAGLTRVNSGLEQVLGATRSVDDATRSAGESLVDNSLALTLLERTLGDTVFPRVQAAHETLSATADMIVAFNETLEAANRLPFVDVPTLTPQLETATGRMDEVRTSVQEVQDTVRAIKEDKVARPIAVVTDRTGRMITNLDAAQVTVSDTLTQIATVLPQLASLRERLPGLIDLMSVLITAVLLWLGAAQAYVLARSYEYLTGKNII